MADSLFKDTWRFVRTAWVAVALGLVFGVFLSIQSCIPEPEIASLAWAEESRLSSQSTIPSSSGKSAS